MIRLVFSSRGHFNIGGYDVFYSTLMDNGNGQPPLNVGVPINTTDDDVSLILFMMVIRHIIYGYSRW